MIMITPNTNKEKVEKERCETCRFYKDKMCCRYPPSLSFEPMKYGFEGKWPEVKWTDWCGEYRGA